MNGEEVAEKDRYDKSTFTADAEGPVVEGDNHGSNLKKKREVLLTKAAAPSNYKLLQLEADLGELEKETKDDNGTSGEASEETETHCCGRCYSTMWDNYPRCSALWLRVVVPMFALMLLGFLGGWALARSEAPDEVVANDEIMRARKVIRTTDWNDTAHLLLDLPVICMD